MNDSVDTGQLPEPESGPPTMDPAETRARVEAARARRVERQKARRQQQTTRMLQIAVVVVLVALAGVLSIRLARVVIPARSLGEWRRQHHHLTRFYTWILGRNLCSEVRMPL